MDNFQRLRHRAHSYLILLNILSVGIGITVWVIATANEVPSEITFVLAVCSILFMHFITSYALIKHILQPLGTIWQAILHISPDTVNIPAPDMTKLQFGRELVLSLTNRVYQYASKENNDEKNRRETLSQAINIIKLFPQPLFVFNKDQIVTNVSSLALEYLNIESSQLLGQKLFESISLDFPGTTTMEEWATDCRKNKVTDHRYWRRIRIHLKDGETIKQCDIAAYYNRNNESGTEFIVTFTDRSDDYGQDDEELSFIALAVHELRTPLTMLRGYVEALEDELDGKLDAELTGFLHKLQIATDQLTSFVTNILNVVKIDEDQLTLKLYESDWNSILEQASSGMSLRAKLLGKTIKFDLKENLPTVAIDPMSISVVISNLLDNALKYSGETKEIIVSARLNQEGFVETTVRDFGVGIPTNVIPNIFERFYRNHRTKNQFSGTGLGLYLSKAILTAHGGNVWVKSKPDEGSSFTFTLQQYASVADSLKNRDNSDITSHAHGWIKNHSMYRR